MNVNNLRVVLSRFLCSYFGYSNLSELGRNNKRIRVKNEKENSLGFLDRGLARQKMSSVGYGLAPRAT